jgi:hypothetical protein
MMQQLHLVEVSHPIRVDYIFPQPTPSQVGIRFQSNFDKLQNFQVTTSKAHYQTLMKPHQNGHEPLPKPLGDECTFKIYRNSDHILILAFLFINCLSLYMLPLVFSSISRGTQYANACIQQDSMQIHMIKYYLVTTQFTALFLL